ncbi:MFS transporter [Prauserella rugosa]|uniref:MFS transporter n=1 Tax=Prauserella rugosa TaxID=43354 RepID=UPI000671EBD1|nr:MFS transporter [Prauserella rugosa]KMS65993.1 MFS transporter [Streptomyces regensis]
MHDHGNARSGEHTRDHARHGNRRHGGGAERITVIRPSRLKRTISGTAVGNMMEWYDFGIFAFLVPTISQVFFAGQGSGSVVATFTMFAAAFVARPIGGMIFGPLGDRLGRRRVLAITMITMACGTLGIGLIPSYEAIGFWSPLLLLLGRLVQGFSTGGEYAGAMTYLGEHSPDTRRGFLTSWLEFGTLSGYVLGAAVATTVTTVVPEQALLSWGWRIPFLVAGPLGLIGLYVRTRLEESPAFEQQTGRHDTSEGDRRAGDTGSESSAPDSSEPPRRSVREQFRDTVIKPWRPLLVCIGLVVTYNVVNYTLTQYFPTYLSEEVGLPATPALLIVLGVMVVLIAIIPFGGRLSDRIGRNPILYTGCGLVVVASVPAFLLVNAGGYLAAFAGTLLIGLTLLCFNSTLPSTLPALFPVDVRYGTLAIAYNVATSVFGGTTPLIASSLVAGTGNPIVPAFLLIAAGIIGAISVVFTREKARRPLPGSPPSAANEEEARQLAEERRSAD